MSPIVRSRFRLLVCAAFVFSLLGLVVRAAGTPAVSGPGIPAGRIAAVVDTDGDGIPDAQDNCPTIPNSGQENTDLTLDESFECGVFVGWDFTYSSEGQQSGSYSNGAGIWSSTLVTTPLALRGTSTARLYADSPQHGGSSGPWNAKAAIHSTVAPFGILQSTLQFDQIQGNGGVGGSWFRISVINAADPTKVVSYGFNTTGDASADFKTTVSAGERVNFNANVADDYFNKYGENLSGSAILQFMAYADYAESGTGRRTTEVRLDDVRVLSADPFGDACDYCAAYYNLTTDPVACSGAIAEALDLPSNQKCDVSFTGDSSSLAVSTRFGDLSPSLGEDFVVMCTGPVFQELAQPGTDYPGIVADRATLTLNLTTPPGVCGNTAAPAQSTGNPCQTDENCTGGETCTKSSYFVRFCYTLLTAEYPEYTDELSTTFSDSFTVTLTDSGGPVTLAEYSGTTMDSPITAAPASFVSGSQFDIPPTQCNPEAGFAQRCVNVRMPLDLLSDQVTLEFSIEEPVSQTLDSCVLLDGLRLTNLEVVDPNPDLLDGSGQIKSNRQDLKQGGRDVGGAAADGVTRVLLREEVALPIGQVEFCLDTGTAGEYEDGGVSALGDTALDPCVAVCVEDLGLFDYFAFAVYWAPGDFNRGGADYEGDRLSAQRRVDFRATWYPACPCGIPLDACPLIAFDAWSAFKLVRPPLVLVHGLWSNEKAWDKFPLYKNGETRERYSIYRAGYEETSASHFARNAAVVPDTIHEAIKRLRDKAPELAVTQADVGAHSMGGVLSRRFISNGTSRIPKYKYKENFFSGDIHKLVTLDTPHLGSPLAGFLIDLGNLPCVGGTVLTRRVEFCAGKYIKDIFRNKPAGFAGPIDEGAIEDLQVCSAPLQRISAASVPGHAMVGRLVEGDWQGIQFAIIKASCKFMRFICRAVDLIKVVCGSSCSLDDTLAPLCSCDSVGALITSIFQAFAPVETVAEGDGIVGVVSQKGGITSSATTLFTQLPDAIHVFNTSSTLYSDQLEFLLNTPTTAIPSPFGTWPKVQDQCPSKIVGKEFIRMAQDVAEMTAGTASLTILLITPPTNDCPPVSGTMSYRVVVGSTALLDTVHVAGASALAVCESTDPGPCPESLCLNIPEDVAGEFEIRAFAVDKDGDYLSSKPQLLTIEPTATISELVCSDDHMVFLGIGDEKRLRVTGIYDDGIERDVTDLAATSYSATNTGVVELDTRMPGLVPMKGILRAVGPGLSVVSASLNDKCCSILVEVGDGQRPRVNAGTDQIAHVGDGVTLGGTVDCGVANEACPLPPVYQWEQLSGPLANLSDATAPNPTFIPGVIGEFVFQLVVDGGNLLSTPDTVTIFVDNPPTDPTIPAVSTWGVVALTLLLLAAGSVIVRCRIPLASRDYGSDVS